MRKDIETSFKNTILELKHYKQRQKVIDAEFDLVKSDKDVANVKDMQEKSDLSLRKAFYKDTKSFNSWENVSIVDIKFIFKCAGENV